MADYTWPTRDQRKLIGKRIPRVDAPLKVSGRATYTYDVSRPGMLFGKILRAPYAKGRILSIDVSAAEKHPGVKAVHIIQKPGTVVHWASDEIVAVAATSELAAEDAIRSIRVEYERLPHFVSDDEPGRPLPGPMSQDDIADALTRQLPAADLKSLLQDRGVSFHTSQHYFEELMSYGVSAATIDAIAVAPYREWQDDGTHEHYVFNDPVVAGDPDQAFSGAEVISEGLYGMPCITHCCLESHGAIAEWTDADHLLVHMSTQNVSGIADQMAEPLKIPAANIRVRQDHVGGSFGSKFSPDRWGMAAARLSRKAGGKPVRIMLERDAELAVAGARPSAYARVKVAARKDGTITAWQSNSWASGGVAGGGMPPVPYVFNIENTRTQHTAIRNNVGPARAWRAPNHPQACLITMAALDDLADKLGMDPLDLFLKNIELTAPRQAIYREELPIAADLMDWKTKWHPRGESVSGSIAHGVGVSLHTYGGRGHESNCDLTIHPDGAVAIQLGSQDLGTGTRTCIQIVAAETLGLPLEAIQLRLGDTNYPASRGSGGSSTVGGVSAATRRAAVDARDALFARVAPALKAAPADLECSGGEIRVRTDPSRSLSWKQACATLGARPIRVRGRNSGWSQPGDLTASGVGGVQMAEVEVDRETGVVRVKKMVAVQDCGLIIDLQTAESQCRGALIMGISYSLFEEKITDPITGRMLNPNLEFYRLAGFGDIPELVVHMMTGKGYDERGVIGLGEPPVISPGAAISNAVANALGVRVPFLPLTPDRVLAALTHQEHA